ncbi:hypothetical protein ASPBRDRAFT_42083 [Aspergillus brasiliensis CBS 101740]|uniref:Uncharacterized protein n=1 Tax=Aspergillus brasiliensis (strain CBS 101740 / IMI 381727 / IBT 21946) TaxID=767769 RepID=A0A1L9UL70_ASPBC|nr:hypothetical protein ASPBRDRAFT_42083 [Aspergillus brasiliensis CBS 101740]
MGISGGILPPLTDCLPSRPLRGYAWKYSLVSLLFCLRGVCPVRCEHRSFPAGQIYLPAASMFRLSVCRSRQVGGLAYKWPIG